MTKQELAAKIWATAAESISGTADGGECGIRKNCITKLRICAKKEGKKRA